MAHIQTIKNIISNIYGITILDLFSSESETAMSMTKAAQGLTVHYLDEGAPVPEQGRCVVVWATEVERRMGTDPGSPVEYTQAVLVRSYKEGTMVLGSRLVRTHTFGMGRPLPFAEFRVKRAIKWAARNVRQLP